MFTTLRGISTRTHVVIYHILLITAYSFHIVGMEGEKRFRPIERALPSISYISSDNIPSLRTLCIRHARRHIPTLRAGWQKLPASLQEQCIIEPDSLGRPLPFFITTNKEVPLVLELLSMTSESQAKNNQEKIILRRDLFNESILTYMIKIGKYAIAYELIQHLTKEELKELERFNSPAKQEQRASPSFYPHYTTSNSALYQAACCGQIDLKRALEAKVEYEKLMPQGVLKAIHKKFKQKFPEIDEEEYTDSDEEASAEICLNNSCPVDEAGRTALFYADISHIPFYVIKFPQLITQKDNFGKTPFEYFLFTNQCDKAITLVNSLKENAIPLEERALTKMLHTTIKIGNTPLLQHLLTAFSPLPSFILLESLKQSLKYSQQFPQVIEHFLNFIEATATQDKPQPLEEFNHFAVGYIDRGGYLIHEVARYAPQLVEKFINLGLDVTLSSTNYFKYTPLMVAIRSHPEVYPAFIKPSILHKKSSNGLTALDYAQREKREEWVKALICHLSSTNPEQTV